jgi:diguanylate cyclase (GGDEF)-like protein/PAS domain S-box-containing protein/putative nucleotidyltransferase with HDIG domain
MAIPDQTHFASPPGDAPSVGTHAGPEADALRAVARGDAAAFCRQQLQWIARDNQLLQVRLGVATSLFAALRLKHAETASHSLRVTMMAATWAALLDMTPEQRDVVEVASLLHDVGKIGIPDQILLKPGPLNATEAQIMQQHRRLGAEILRSSCACDEILSIVTHGGAWYDGSRGTALAGEAIPLGARMLSIVDAYDAMTSDQIYRPALPQERAVQELYRHAGTQFDPALVELFVQHLQRDHFRLREEVVGRWLQDLRGDHINRFWHRGAYRSRSTDLAPLDPFLSQLVDNLRDAVVFVDATRRILRWNLGAERLTGIPCQSVYQRPFLPSLLELREEDGRPVHDDDCPVLQALRSGEQRLRRALMRGRNGRPLTVELHVVPVSQGRGTLLGATVVLRDVSPELSLVARCQSLHELATKDPLTQVANRAEFDRVHERFVAAHLETLAPYALIVADIDHFKSINDRYGHQAGDEVLKDFARLLKSMCRAGDLVARYGGEEFVMLCADCTAAAAVSRAEEIRRAVSQMVHPALGNRSVTCSFGVTEIQPGDTPATMLARADRALYQAKANGRNTVVQLGTGIRNSSDDRSAQYHDATEHRNILLQRELVTYVPRAMAIEKLRGFVADQQASIVSSTPQHVRLKTGGGWFFRRSTDRQVPLIIDVHFDPPDQSPPRESEGRLVATRMRVAIALRRARDRRRSAAMERARQLLASFKAYLMAVEPETPAEGVDVA